MSDSALEKIAETAFSAIEQAFGINIALHDLRGTIRHKSGKVLLPHRHIHRHPCCVYDRYNQPGWDVLCYRDCFTQSEHQATTANGPFIKTCWKGLGELVIPLIHDQHHLITIYAGVFKIQGMQEGPDFPDDPIYLEMRDKVMTANKEFIESLSALLILTGRGLLNSITAQESEPDAGRGTEIRAFINRRAHQPVTITDLAKHLHLSPSRTGHVVRENTGMNFHELLLKERMLRAKNLLISSRQPLDEIAGNLGFRNEFYFNRVFKKYFGMPPGEYRNNNYINNNSGNTV